MYDLSKVPDQQDKANLLSTDTSIFQLVPKTKILQIPNADLIYLAKQLFGKAQRKYIHKYCPNVARSTGNYCGALLDSRDLHLRTCRMNNVNHEKHEALKYWFQELAKQAHIQTAPAPPISEVSRRNPTKQLAGDLMLVDVSLRQAGRDGKCGVLDFSIVLSHLLPICTVLRHRRNRSIQQNLEKKRRRSNTYKPTRILTTRILSRLSWRAEVH